MAKVLGRYAFLSAVLLSLGVTESYAFYCPNLIKWATSSEYRQASYQKRIREQQRAEDHHQLKQLKVGLSELKAIHKRNSDLLSPTDLVYFRNPEVKDIEALASSVGLNLQVNVDSAYSMAKNIRRVFDAITAVEKHIQQRIETIEKRLAEPKIPAKEDSGI